VQGAGRAAAEGGLLIFRQAAAVIALVVWQGCAGAPPKTQDARAIPRDHPRAALLPLENLTTAADAGDVMTRIVWNELARSGAVELSDPGNVDAALEAMHIRAMASLTSDQIRILGDTLGVQYLFLGSVIESGKLQTAEGEVPSIGVALRMVGTETARVIWAGSHFRSGDDRETIFGWGRVRSADRLAAEVASDMLEDFRKVGRETKSPIDSVGGSK